MCRFCIICRDAVYRVSLLALIVGIGLPSYAYNDYSATKAYDSYSQSWQSYKQQNNINVQSAYQQSWWDKTIASIGNFFSDVGSAVNRTLNNIGNFFTAAYNSVHNFFIKTPDIKINQANAPSTKELDATYRVSTPERNIQVGINKDNQGRDAIPCVSKKDNPYAYLTAEKACYDPRAIGLSQFSSKYQAIEAEYVARDKWMAAQQAQPEGKLAGIGVGANDHSPAVNNDQDATSRVSMIDQKNISVIAPAVVTHPDPSVMPAESWERVKQTLPVDNTSPKQTTAVKFYADKAQALGNDLKQFNDYIHSDWKNADSNTEAGVKGALEGFSREVKSEDLYTPIQKFFQHKSDQITNVTIAAIRGLDIVGVNAGNEKGFLQAADKISIGTMKGCVVAGAVVAQTLVDVGKFGSEIPQIMANAVLAKDAFASGDIKQAWRYVGNAVGGIGRETARATIFGSLIKSMNSAIDVASIPTKYGPALQSTSQDALAVKAQINTNTLLYRLGSIGKSEAGEAQFWSLENPATTPNFAQKYGIPQENVTRANFIQCGTIKPNTPFITREAPRIGENGGGEIEVVVQENGINSRWFHSKGE